MSDSDRMAALEWAADYAQRHGMFDQPLNARGYPQDGTKPPTPSEKADIILKLASWAIAEKKSPQGTDPF